MTARSAFGTFLVGALSLSACAQILGLDESLPDPNPAATAATSSSTGGPSPDAMSEESSVAWEAGSDTGAVETGGGETGAQDGGKTYASCAEILGAGTIQDGRYPLVTNGQRHDVYCDLADGGWTLALKLGNSGADFSYGSAVWTDDSVLNGDSTNLDQIEAKFPSFRYVGFSQVRLRFGPTGTPLEFNVPSTSSLKTLFSGSVVEMPMRRAAWLAALPNSALQPNTWEGINLVIDKDPGHFLKARIGIVANNETSRNTPDSVIGIGIDYGRDTCSGRSNLVTSGNQGCDDTLTNASGATVSSPHAVPSFAYVFVR
jgi:hypothetical protein